MDAIVAKPFGVEAMQKERDLAYVDSLFHQLLVELADALNAVHTTHHSLRYWHIVVGHWLRRHVSIAFNRYFTVDQALREHAVLGTTIFHDPYYSLATKDSLSAIWASNDDVWNHVLYANIVQFMGNVQTESRCVRLSDAGGFRSRAREPQRLTAQHYLRTFATTILQRLSRQSDAVMVATYLPPLQAAKLQLSMGQCPQLWPQVPINDVDRDPEERSRFQLSSGPHVRFEQFVRQSISDALPICYLEGYAELVEQAQALPWPRKPKFVFTSNRFDTDEVFKAWTASLTEQGVPYFAGQHGNNYGTALETSGSPELEACDKFFTWGWTNDSPRNIPASVFKLAGRRRRRPLPDGGLLLVEVSVPHRVTPWDAYFEFGLYQEEQFRFVQALPAAIKNDVTVRLHAEHRNHHWSDELRWRDRGLQMCIDSGATAIVKLIAQSRLVVHSYDSTGCLETLAMNTPTLCFWRGGFSHLLPSAKPYYNLLKSAGIYHDTPEQAAAHVGRYWDDIGGWWVSDVVQDARQKFCDKFCRTEPRPIRTMKRLLEEACVGTRVEADAHWPVKTR